MHRLVLWIAGVVAATATMVGPLAAAAHEGFVAHMWAHLLAGMLAPLLLVLSAPVTLALRTLEVVPARRVSRVLRSGPARFVAHPITAAALNVGGLWLLYATPLFAWMQASMLVHVAVHVHLLAAGFLFTAAVVGIGPRPHPPSRVLVAVVLMLAMAAHGILAKHLWASPPALVDPADARAGAELMYTAGAWIEAAIAALFCAQWYRASGRRLRRTSPAPAASPVPTP
ncbi:cytochrome c oxidase assembly protein [Agrococcus versicolor]|uniref:Cytochrome c oxidase assembly protein n=1 Tax=Agrococcus versicolor TaxID=501482 RepID=A0ABN3AID4_9MICO